MRIAMVNLTGGGLSGGGAKYLSEFMPLLRGQPEIDELHGFVPEQVSNGFGEAHADSITPIRNRDILSAYRQLRSDLRQLAPDVVFLPASRFLPTDGRPSVVMVRNMEPLVVPFGGNGAVESLKNIARAQETRLACRAADRVIAVSEFVSDYLRERWSLPEQKISVIYHGVQQPPPPGRVPGVEPSLDGKPFLLTVGSIRPARGLEDLIRALPRLQGRARDYDLVIAGSASAGERYPDQMRELARKLGVAERIRWVGNLDEASLTWCFEHADAFIMTSRAEACPNIVLEALAAGALSVSTDTKPMPEFFGDCADYYRAENPQSLAERLDQLLAAESASHAGRRAAARERALRYTWKHTAEATIAALRRVVEDSR